jgi:hypothetical protein
MSDERRERWNCCQVLHCGEGPETTPWTDILGVNNITADEAAQCYAQERMGGVDCEDYGDGDVMYVAVEQSSGQAAVYLCHKYLDVRIEPRFDCERTDLVVHKRPGQLTE